MYSPKTSVYNTSHIFKNKSSLHPSIGRHLSLQDREGETVLEGGRERKGRDRGPCGAVNPTPERERLGWRLLLPPLWSG